MSLIIDHWQADFIIITLIQILLRNVMKRIYFNVSIDIGEQAFRFLLNRSHRADVLNDDNFERSQTETNDLQYEI